MLGEELEVKHINRGTMLYGVVDGDNGHGVVVESKAVVVVGLACEGGIHPGVVFATHLDKGGVVINAGEGVNLDSGNAVAATEDRGEDVEMNIGVGDGVATPEEEASGAVDGHRGDVATVAVAGHDGNVEDAGTAAGSGGGGSHRIGAVVGGMADGSGGDDGVNPGGQISLGEESVASDNLDGVGHSTAERGDGEVDDTVASVGGMVGLGVGVEVADGVGAPQVEATGRGNGDVLFGTDLGKGDS